MNLVQGAHGLTVHVLQLLLHGTPNPWKNGNELLYDSQTKRQINSHTVKNHHTPNVNEETQKSNTDDEDKHIHENTHTNTHNTQQEHTE